MKADQKMIWTPVCMSIGIGLGMLIGSVHGQLPAGLCVSGGLGLVVGVIADRISGDSNELGEDLSEEKNYP